ncbi:DUF4389 domain-containing protein [Marinomonas ostreistagni]|uniref:DUF4389 domain-containing protein n=1 Tax=Marinomonas ostreistagni TaxID=359209 RepID=UPI0019524F89|nr:DUF4389 domain-containing protein [Marinomonas ostreistagni]MBM6550190.1 DUF4389 domain-containing protein [Marinomonas ostreistagni]
MNKPGYANQDFWIRMLFMLIYWGLLNIALTVFGFLVIIGAAVRLVCTCDVPTLDTWLTSVGGFIKQTISFLAFNTEEKPFPFQSWPQGNKRED